MVPADDAYDPLEETHRPTHFSKKEAKVVAVALFVLIMLSTPVYLSCRGQSYKHVCKQNILGISKAMNLYAAANNDLLPPVYFGDSAGNPVLDPQGRAFTWASLVSEYLGSRTDFICPAAPAGQNSRVQHLTDSAKTIQLSYGMYLPRGLTGLYSFRDSATAVLFSETANRGANETYNPIPLEGAAGGPSDDGFAIGWDTPQLGPESKFVTRLAFPGTSGGVFGDTGGQRHDGGNWFLFTDGHAEPKTAASARIRFLGSQAEGYWSTR